jgi:hypothetical protein
MRRIGCAFPFLPSLSPAKIAHAAFLDRSTPTTKSKPSSVRRSVFSSDSLPPVSPLPPAADHLTLLRLLSTVPHLQPSVRFSFWMSSDPLSPKYEERSVAIRTEQAHVEHHLFKLLPEWLQAVKKEGLGRTVVRSFTFLRPLLFLTIFSSKAFNSRHSCSRLLSREVASECTGMSSPCPVLSRNSFNLFPRRPLLLPPPAAKDINRPMPRPYRRPNLRGFPRLPSHLHLHPPPLHLPSKSTFLPPLPLLHLRDVESQKNFSSSTFPLQRRTSFLHCLRLMKGRRGSCRSCSSGSDSTERWRTERS